MAQPRNNRVFEPGGSNPATDAFEVTPSDATDFTVNARALYIGVSGDVTLVTAGGTVVTFANVPVGILPVECSRVNDTGTDATDIVGLL